jgi:DNA-binding MarR family transcriptional regulator
VTVSLLVAARNRELLYDISRWGEDVGLASKATFSRTKSQLEERGLLDTEKVPIDVGRPRLRLRLTDGLAEAPVAELTRKARARLSD